MDDARSNETSPAVEAFAEYLALCENGTAPDFDAYCAGLPDLSDELRRIRIGWERASGAIAAPPVGAGLDPDRPPAADEPSTRSPSTTERYEIFGEVGRGGMGIVLRVRDSHLRRTLAMKVLHAERCTDRRATVRFLEEAQVAAQLEHPGIVPIYDIGLDAEGRVYYTMPLVRGRDCGQLFELARTASEGWTRTRALHVLLRVCEAVAAAHSRGVVHRDLKPSNVMVGPLEEVYVVDWGLARVLDAEHEQDEAAPLAAADIVESVRRETVAGDSDSSLGTVAGQVVGTPSYMAPEQARGEPVDRRSDVYAVGTMLYLLWSGVRPYEAPGERTDSDVVLERLLAGPPRPLRKVAPDAPAALAAICDKAMAREPGERYADMGAMADDLRAFLESRVVSAYRVGAVAELRSWVERNRALAGAIAGLFLSLAVGLAATLVLKGRSDSNAQLAELNFGSAMDAVERMLTRVGSVELADVPRVQPVRRELLVDALELYEDLLQRRPHDPSLLLAVASAHGQLASVHGLLGNPVEAEAEMTRAIHVVPEAILAGANEEEGLLTLSWYRVRRANLSRQLGKHDEARADLRAGLEEVNLALRTDPTWDTGLFRKTTILNTLAVSYLQTSERKVPEDMEAEVEEWLRDAIQAADQLRERGATNVRKPLVNALGNLSVVLYDQGRFEEAEVPSRRALAIHEEAVVENPAGREELQVLSTLQSQLAISLAQQDKPEAAEMFRGIIETTRTLTDEYPSIPAYKTQLGSDLMNLGRWTCEHGDHAGASELYDEALRVGMEAYTAAPDDDFGRYALVQMHENLHRCWRDLGRHVEMASRVDELVQLDPDRPQPYGSLAARAMAYCAGIVGDDESLAPSERAALREAYLTDLVRRFHRMAEQGFADPGDLEEEWFDPLREHPSIVELAAFLEREAASDG